MLDFGYEFDEVRASDILFDEPLATYGDGAFCEMYDDDADVDYYEDDDYAWFDDIDRY
jgi:hypothetical protein